MKLHPAHCFLQIVLIILLIGCQNSSASKSIREIPIIENDDFILPFPVGNAYQLLNSYCGEVYHFNRLTYNLIMPLGGPIAASQSGTVEEVVNHFKDKAHSPAHNNRVLIRHADNTIALYVHLKKGSLIVKTGDVVEAGDVIGSCGASGRTGGIPHLHFEVFQDVPYNSIYAIPVGFSNLSGRTDSARILIAGEAYEALPF